MARLPVPGSDNGVWGNVLNDFLGIEHNTDGSLKIRTDGTFYTKPGSGIPASDMTASVQSTLNAVAGKINASTATTKGDLLVATAASTIARLGAGSNGQYLIADDGETTGVRWVDDAVLHAEYYGVTANGTTDDAANLQIAIDQAILQKKPLLLPVGTIIIGTTLSVSGTVTIIGSGRESTTLKAENGLADYVMSFTGGAAGVGIIGAYLSDFKIDGNSANVTGGGGIEADGAVQCTFERLHLTSCYNWGLKLGPITGGAFGHHNRVVNCLFDQGGLSAGFGGGVWTTSSDENWFYGSDFEYLGGATAPIGTNPIMFYDQAGLQHIVATNFVAGSNNAIGLRIQNTKDTKVVGCTFDGTAGDSVFIAAVNCLISGNVFTSPGDNGSVAASGVHLEFNTHYNVVSGNILETAVANGKTRSLIREEGTGGSGDNIITDNALILNGTVTQALLEPAGAATSIIRDNVGWKTDNTGTATVPNGATTIAVNHGLSATPALANISVTPTNNLGTATKFWISGVGATQFTINVDVDPGAGTATFAWTVRM